jgi:acetyl-CoA C-acetyltransferase
MSLNPRTPVLVGYGQINHHQDATGEQNTPEPVDLMVAAAREAADPRVLEAVDSVRVVNLLSANYRDPGLLLGQHIGADHPATRYSGIGGNVAHPNAIAQEQPAAPLYRAGRVGSAARR